MGFRDERNGNENNDLMVSFVTILENDETPLPYEPQLFPRPRPRPPINPPQSPLVQPSEQQQVQAVRHPPDDRIFRRATTARSPLSQPPLNADEIEDPTVTAAQAPFSDPARAVEDTTDLQTSKGANNSTCVGTSATVETPIAAGSSTDGMATNNTSNITTNQAFTNEMLIHNTTGININTAAQSSTIDMSVDTSTDNTINTVNRSSAGEVVAGDTTSFTTSTVAQSSTVEISIDDITGGNIAHAQTNNIYQVGIAFDMDTLIGISPPGCRRAPPSPPPKSGGN